MNDLWRVDDELLTVVRVPRENLHEDCPIGYWLPVMMGAGSYIYVESEDIANALLKDSIKDEINRLTGKLEEME